MYIYFQQLHLKIHVNRHPVVQIVNADKLICKQFVLACRITLDLRPLVVHSAL